MTYQRSAVGVGALDFSAPWWVPGNSNVPVISQARSIAALTMRAPIVFSANLTRRLKVRRSGRTYRTCAPRRA